MRLFLPSLVLVGLVLTSFGGAQARALDLINTFSLGANSVVGDATSDFRSIGPRIGAEIAFGTPFEFEYGLRADGSVVNKKSDPSQSGLIGFFGGVVRVFNPGTSLYIDGVFGVSPRFGGLFSDETAIAAGIGFGYRHAFSGASSAGARLSYRLNGMDVAGKMVAQSCIALELSYSFTSRL